MMQPDITLNRNRGNVASADAHAKAMTRSQWLKDKIVAMLEQADLDAKEIARRLGEPLHKISPRLSELKRDGVLELTGLRDHDSDVLRLVRTQRRMF